MPEVVAQQVKSDVGLASALRSSTLRLSRQLRRQRVGGHDLTANQLGVLGALGKHDAMTIGELAAHEQVKPPSMTRIVSNMEEAGLVVRRPHETDKRQIVVDLTPAAHDLLLANRRRRDEWLQTKLKKLTPEERDILRKAAPVLERLAAT
ncbi:MarR family winged helix-turn-helix transcriptional regulator [Kribbella sp. CA-293567]|uniref:MarR family winged helix-turn-helix transcriptional regulator n=1 Tax=Kribbella sp. CA-293567 TaxID=3002436 RepID=UPI0022DE06BA|nr:MarR family transcriptional regulator [Kribbella sp. CA-293567]WBQ06595.1 MarR family transcriptional regulator [Kribbella sp. CA-293567]